MNELGRIPGHSGTGAGKTSGGRLEPARDILGSWRDTSRDTSWDITGTDSGERPGGRPEHARDRRDPEDQEEPDGDEDGPYGDLR